VQTIRPATALIPCALAAALALAAPAAASPPTCDDALRAVQGADTLELTLACDDARHRRLSYQATMPLHGSLSLDQTGHGRYTPMLGFEGTDTFSYWAVAGGEESNHATATVTVTEPNAFPCDDSTGQTQAGERLTVHVVCSVQGGRRLRYHATQPRHGFVKLNSSGEGVWQADPSYVGTDEFTYWAVAQTDAGPLKSSLGTLRFRFVRRVPPLKPPQITLSPAAGSVRVKLGGGWRSLTRARTVTHPVLIDARQGRVKLAARYGLDDSHSSGSFSYGMFKVEHGPAEGSIAPRQYPFSKIALVGPRCGGSQARSLDATVSRGRFTVKLARFSATALARSRFTLGDLCVGVSVVNVRSGPVIAPGGEVLHTNESYQEPNE
jgi:Big-like domain-containing protein